MLKANTTNSTPVVVIENRKEAVFFTCMTFIYCVLTGKLPGEFP